MTGLEEWTVMVGRHAARHVERGVPVDEAVQLGMADYRAQLHRLYADLRAADGAGATADDRRRARAAVDHVAERVWRAVRA